MNCPKCKAQYAKDSKIEYCVCGHKFVKFLSFMDLFLDPNLGQTVEDMKKVLDNG
jgi:hypothetical protein